MTSDRPTPATSGHRDDSAPSRISRRTVLGGAVAATLLAGSGGAAVVATSAADTGTPAVHRAQTPRRGQRLFTEDSPWNTPIPDRPRLDRRNAAIQREVLRDTAFVVNTILYEFGIPFYTATPATPRVRLSGRGAIAGRVPLDPAWRTNTGADAKMNILDPAAGLVYELQEFDVARRTVYWMVVRDYRRGRGDSAPSGGRHGPTGSGLTQAGGVIRLEEIREGRIDHALSFITSDPAAGRFRYPATHTDGSNTNAGAIEQGMRIQLDPALDLDRLGLERAEQAIGRALQVYGAYCTDTGRGNNMALGFYAERPTSTTADPYPAAGLRGDWAQLRAIPRSAYRVLAASVTRP